MHCVTQAERALVCARQTVGQRCNVRKGEHNNKTKPVLYLCPYTDREHATGIALR